MIQWSQGYGSPDPSMCEAVGVGGERDVPIGPGPSGESLNK